MYLVCFEARKEGEEYQRVIVNAGSESELKEMIRRHPYWSQQRLVDGERILQNDSFHPIED
jgi:hypothetical protein